MKILSNQGLWDFVGLDMHGCAFLEPQKFKNKKHVASPYGGILPGWNSAAWL